MPSLFTAPEAKLLRCVSAIAYANPFLSELAHEERQALGREFVAQHPFWSLEVDDPDKRRANTWKLLPKIDRILDSVPLRTRRGASPSDAELRLYEDAALYSMYHQFHDRLFDLAVSQRDGRTPYYKEFLALWARAHAAQ